MSTAKPTTNGSVDTPVAPSLYSKLAAVMAEIGYVEKRGFNKFHGYKYVTEADLVDAVREKLALRNVILIPSVVAIDERGVTSDKGKASTVTTVRVAFTFCDGDSGEMHRAEWAGCGDDPADKGLYKAYTGAVKYFLMKSFLIPTGDDPEADEGTDKRSAGGQASAPVRQVMTADPVKATERPATAKQRGLINAKAADAGLTAPQLANVLLVATGQQPREFTSDDHARELCARWMDRLPATSVDPILEQIEHGQVTA